MTGSLLPLRDRLLLIAAREVDDRVLSPGEAETLVNLIDAVKETVPWILLPSDVPEGQRETLGRRRAELLDALRPFGWAYL